MFCPLQESEEVIFFLLFCAFVLLYVNLFFCSVLSQKVYRSNRTFFSEIQPPIFDTTKTTSTDGIGLNEILYEVETPYSFSPQI